MITYDLSKTSGDGAESGFNDNGPFTYNGGDGINVNLSKHMSNTAYTKYTHQHPKDAAGQTTIQFNKQPVKLSGYNPSNKLAGVDVYFLRYNKGQGGKGPHDSRLGKGGHKGPGQETDQDEYPFLVVFKESEKGSGPGSGEINRIFFGDPAGSGVSTESVEWNKWDELTQGKYITDARVRLQMKLKQIERAWSELGHMNDVRSTAYQILKAEDGKNMVKFKSGNDNDYTVGHKQSINGGYYKHIFATWREGSNLGSNCLLEVDGKGGSKCSEPTVHEDSMKNKIDQYYIDQVKREQYKIIKAYFDIKGSQPSGLKNGQKDNLLLVEFVDEFGNTKYLRRRDMNGNWWSLREAKYVSGQKGLSAGNLLQRLNDISSGTKDKKVTAFILDKVHGEYKGVKEFKGDTYSNTAYNTYRHDLKGDDPGVRTVLLFGGEVIHIDKLKPSRVGPNSVQVYYLKTKCGKGHDGGSDDKHPFLVVLEGTGKAGGSGTRIYHLNDPKGSEGSKESNDWSKWEAFRNTKKYGVEQDVVQRLQEKLEKIESECEKLPQDQQARRISVYQILTEVDKAKGEEEDPAVEEDGPTGGGGPAVYEEEQEFEDDEQDYVKEIADTGSSGDENEKEKVEEEAADISTDAFTSNVADSPDGQDATVLEGPETVTRLQVQEPTMQSVLTGDSAPGSDGQVGVGRQGHECLSQSGTSRTKRSTVSCPAGNSVGGGSGGSPGPGPTTPDDNGNYVIKIGSAAGTVGIAALTGGGYLWHRLATRTVRDMMAYF